MAAPLSQFLSISLCTFKASLPARPIEYALLYRGSSEGEMPKCIGMAKISFKFNFPAVGLPSFSVATGLQIFTHALFSEVMGY